MLYFFFNMYAFPSLHFYGFSILGWSINNFYIRSCFAFKAPFNTPSMQTIWSKRTSTLRVNVVECEISSRSFMIKNQKRNGLCWMNIVFVFSFAEFGHLKLDPGSLANPHLTRTINLPLDKMLRSQTAPFKINFSPKSHAGYSVRSVLCSGRTWSLRQRWSSQWFHPITFWGTTGRDFPITVTNDFFSNYFF